MNADRINITYLINSQTSLHRPSELENVGLTPIISLYIPPPHLPLSLSVSGCTHTHLIVPTFGVDKSKNRIVVGYLVWLTGRGRQNNRRRGKVELCDTSIQ